MPVFEKSKLCVTEMTLARGLSIAGLATGSRDGGVGK